MPLMFAMYIVYTLDSAAMTPSNVYSQSLRMNVTNDAYYFIIDPNNPPKKLTTLELSYQTDKKTPEEVYRTFNYCAMVGH